MRAAAYLALSLLLLTPLQNWLDQQPRPHVPLDETVYPPAGRALKGFNLGFNALLADWYWLRTIQYFGGKLSEIQAQQADPTTLKLSEAGRWQLEALPGLLEVVTELDPHYLAAYHFGAAFLPDLHYREAVALLEQGIRANPTEWRLHLDLGFLHWRQREFAAAQAAYERGSEVAGAPGWLKVLAATMAAKGNDRVTAQEILRRLYENSTDEYVRQLSHARAQALQAQTELEQLKQLLTSQREQTGVCAVSLAALVQWALRSGLRQELSAAMQIDEQGAPVDPAGFAYVLERTTCTVALNPQTTVERWQD